MDKLRNEMQQVFQEVFGDNQLVLSDSMTGADVPEWDSLGHLNLIIAIEKRFGIRFATAEISRLKEDGQNVGSLIELVKSKRP
jgi:acyl carrier protein